MAGAAVAGKLSTRDVSMNTAPRPIQVAIVRDFAEESWPSMDLVAEMIFTHLDMNHRGEVTVTQIVPTFRRRITRLPLIGAKPFAKNVDRLINRFHDYPSQLRKLAKASDFDIYHIIDHSYAQLVIALPGKRTVVTCHDLDTFRCLLDPPSEPRPRWFRTMTARILRGLSLAGAIACDSEATRDAILKDQIAPLNRLQVIYLGTHPECSPVPNPEADAEAAKLLGAWLPDAPPDLLHVGSNIARKRVDVLLDVFAEVRKTFPAARLIKVGGAFPPGLARRARDLGIEGAVVVLPFFNPQSSKDRAVLAAVYRRASLVLQPSEAEGFGLPMAEALACGVPLLASDIAVLREVGGEGAVYRAVGDVPAWAEAACSILNAINDGSQEIAARRQAGFERAAIYSWTNHAAQLVQIYQGLCDRV